MSDLQDERRSGTDRRDDERRGGLDRRDAVGAGQRNQVQAALWALAGALVVLYLALLAVGGITPSDAPAASIAAAVVALLWLLHSWRRMWSGGLSPTNDRERRGF